MEKYNNADFLSWANEKNLFYERFSLIADRIQGFVIKRVLNNVEDGKEVAARLAWKTTSKRSLFICNVKIFL